MKKQTFVLAILLMASAALSQNASVGNSSIVIEDLQVVPLQPQFGTQAQIQPLRWLTVIDIDCETCTEGEDVTFSLKITNLATRPMALNSILLADTDSLVFGGRDVDTQLAPNQTVTFPIEATLPPATRGHTLYYLPCFTVTDSLGGEPQQSCESVPRRMMLSGVTVESMFISIYILIAIVLLAVAVAYFALSRKLEGFELEEEVSESPN